VWKQAESLIRSNLPLSKGEVAGPASHSN